MYAPDGWRANCMIIATRAARGTTSTTPHTLGERNARFRSAPVCMSARQRWAGALCLLVAHNDGFGVRQAFHRFLFDVLSDAERRALLDKLRLDRNALPDMTPLPGGTEADKARYLYRIRNEYTHDADPGRAFAPIGDNPEPAWTLREQIHRPARLDTVWIRDWIAALTGAVADGLARRVKELAS